MINIKKLKLVLKLLIAVLLLSFVVQLISFTYSKYQSLANSNANVDVAMYVFKKDFQNMNINLEELFPSDTPYIYTFSIGNTNVEKTADIDLDYDLTIRTTTNLPITYDLFMNQKYTDSGAINIIKENTVDTDKDRIVF